MSHEPQHTQVVIGVSHVIFEVAEVAENGADQA